VGFVLVTARIGSQEELTRDIEFLVDTGAFYTALPPELMRELQIEPRLRTAVTIADNRQVEPPVGVAYLEIEDRRGVIFVSQLDLPIPLLGVTALETLGFKVDPVEQRLEQTRPFGPAALNS
jgi:clan AA aspartic protease